ncbi:unnamed protein product, partial [Oncorhynchus mykiss]
MKHLKRKRKSNYSVRETQTLIREIHKRRDVLFSRQQNTAINELKRRAWEEVAGGVNSLGEGELRTSSEVKRRYLDWRSLMKRKQLHAELSLSTGLKAEYDPSSPEHNASLGSKDQSLDLSSFPKESQCDWQDLADLGEPRRHAMSTGIKMEEEVNGYRLEGDSGDGEVEEEEDDDDADDEEDCFPSLLPDMGERDVRIPEVFSHIDEFGMLSASQGTATSINRDLSLGGMGFAGLGLANHESTGLLVGLEKQRVELEKQRVAVETERLARERLQLEKERLQLEKERLRLLLMNQSERASAPPQQGPPSSSTPTTSSSSAVDGQNERNENKPRLSMIDLEGERLSLEKERLQLEKERLQFFKFESGRLQIERERLEVERMQLQQDQDNILQSSRPHSSLQSRHYRVLDHT